jgi:hypothetical protein
MITPKLKHSKLNVFIFSLLLSLATSASWAVTGGNAGGGGNLDTGEAITKDDLRQTLTQIQKPVVGFFKFLSISSYNNRLGYLGTFGENRTDLGKKLYGGPKENAVMAKVLATAPSILDAGPCLDPEGNPKEASALSNPDRICFSLELLSQRKDLRKSNLNTALVALAGHEYSHLVGASEEEAYFLQKEILSNFSEKAYFAVLNKYSDFSNMFHWVSSNLDGLLKDLNNHTPHSSLCIDLGFLLGSAIASNDSFNSHQSGISFISRYEFNQLLPGLYKWKNTFSYCKNDPHTLEQMNKIFGQRTEISLEEYLDAIGSKGYIKIKGLVRKVHYGDQTTLTLELLDLKRGIDAIKEDL